MTMRPGVGFTSPFVAAFDLRDLPLTPTPFINRTLMKQHRPRSHLASALAISGNGLRLAPRNIRTTPQITLRSPRGTATHHSGLRAPAFWRLLFELPAILTSFIFMTEILPRMVGQRLSNTPLNPQKVTHNPFTFHVQTGFTKLAATYHNLHEHSWDGRRHDRKRTGCCE